MKKNLLVLYIAALVALFAAGCAGDTKESGSEGNTTAETTEIQSNIEDEAPAAVLEDGVYSADFDTDSSMFHVNEANDGKGTLTVKDGKMTIHVSLVSQKILNLYVGLAEDAQNDEANVLQPTIDKVTYDDGMEEEVYGFDIPVPALDEEYDVALVGTKGTWYDHKVSVSNPEKIENEENNN